MNTVPEGGKISLRYIGAVRPQGLFSVGQPAKLPDGRLLLLYSDMLKGRPLGSTKIWGIISVDGGFTWSKPELLIHRDDCNACGPRSVSARDGSLFIFYLRFVRWADYTAESKSDVAFYIRREDSLKFTEEGLILDGYCAAGGAIETSKENVVLALEAVDNDAKETVSIAFVSFDRGRTFKQSNILRVKTPPQKDYPEEMGAMEPTVVELSDGRLLMFMRTRLGYQFESYSKDQGLTWSEPKQSSLASGNAPAYLLGLADGRIACSWNPKDRTALHLAVSEDDGKTWKDLGPIARGGSVCYSFMIELTPNELYIVWNNVTGDAFSWHYVTIEALRATLPPKR